MPSREDYEADVRRPGKFEGQPPYVPYFWGNSEWAVDDEGRFLHFVVDDEDVLIFPELIAGQDIWLFENDYGFVSQVDEPSEEDIALYLEPDDWGGDDDSEEEEDGEMED